VFMKVFEVDPPFYLRVEKKNKIGLSGSYCMHLKHWTHIYLLNFNALTGLPFEWFPRKLLWFLWRVLTAFSVNPFKIMRRLVIRGKKCSIHPTAQVEASVLGNNVSIGAGALVRGSYIGDGARISEGAKVLGSVVGDGSEVTWNSILNLSLLYPKACVGIPGVQTVFVGRETFISSMAFVIDVKFQGGYIAVRHQGKTVNTRLTTLGPCFGHRVRIGAGVTVNCGREVPNDTAIIQDQEPLLSKLPEPAAPPGIYTVKKGTLSPVGGLPPAALPAPDRRETPG
jgi:UDP-N-acetylglucosamine diphosphorylase / glucose-1-phosphate thymidylyltransferase / UDP-N-acetylgalactosamine diphosphorylase / glucosamine-1-phosphate N-acetyltransferase / galactosamine-1-phosphate N-acetyltransferase